jgi:hypothetical protein
MKHSFKFAVLLIRFYQYKRYKGLIYLWEWLKCECDTDQFDSGFFVSKHNTNNIQLKTDVLVLAITLILCHL